MINSVGRSHLQTNLTMGMSFISTCILVVTGSAVIQNRALCFRCMFQKTIIVSGFLASKSVALTIGQYSFLTNILRMLFHF